MSEGERKRVRECGRERERERARERESRRGLAREGEGGGGGPVRVSMLVPSTSALYSQRPCFFCFITLSTFLFSLIILFVYGLEIAAERSLIPVGSFFFFLFFLFFVSCLGLHGVAGLDKRRRKVEPHYLYGEAAVG